MYTLGVHRNAHKISYSLKDLTPTRTIGTVLSEESYSPIGRGIES